MIFCHFSFFLIRFNFCGKKFHNINIYSTNALKLIEYIGYAQGSEISLKADTIGLNLLVGKKRHRGKLKLYFPKNHSNKLFAQKLMFVLIELFLRDRKLLFL